MAQPLSSRSSSLAVSGTAWVFVALILASIYALESPMRQATLTGTGVRFVDPDDCLRVFRARWIADGKAVVIRRMDAVNAPDGAELHWTSPMDWLLAGVMRGARDLSPSTDPLRAVAAVPSALGLFYAATMMVFVRRLAGWRPALLTGALLAVSPPFHRVFQFGHPDHHCMLELLALLAICATPSPPRRMRAGLSGLAAGLAIWVAPQAMLVWAMVLAGLTAGCVAGRGSDVRAWRRARAAWSGAALTVVIIGYVIENATRLGVVAIDRISLFHVVLCALGLFAPAADSPRGPDDANVPRPWRQTAAFVVVVAAFAFWVGADRARIFEFVSRPEFYRWSAFVAELQPLVARANGQLSFTPMHAWLGFAPYAMPALLVFFIRDRRVSSSARVTLAALAFATTLMAVAQRRWMDVFVLGATPVMAIGTVRAGEYLARRVRVSSWAGASLIALALAACMQWPAMRNVLGRTPEGEAASRLPQTRTAYAATLIRESEAASLSRSERRAILSDDGDGPQLLFETGLPVVSTPYHRALDGLLEAAYFFAERDPVTARARLDRLGVRYVAVPARVNELLMQYEQIAFGALRSYDLPEERLDEFGKVKMALHYRPEVAATMAYRLSITPGDNVIPGVRLLRTVREDPSDPGKLTGLLYVVDDLR